MMKAYLSSLLFFSISTLTQGFCAENLDGAVSQLETDMARIRGETALGTYGAKSPSGAPQIDGYDFFVSVDFLWWKLYEGGTEYALKNEISPVSNTHIKGPLKHLNFNWEPGYKASIGTYFDWDMWDVHLDFTSFSTHAQHSATSDLSGLFPLLGQQIMSFSKANAHWHVRFYDLDLVLGKSYFVSKYLALHPYFGLTSAWVQQHRHARYQNPILLKLRGKNNFWGIGPRIGTEAQFYLGRHFSVFGNAVGALLWGKFDVNEKERNLSANAELYDLHDNTHRMAPIVGFELGLAFETNLNHDHNYLRVKVGYEGQYWWRQNQFPLFNATAESFARQSEDLSLQGLTTELRFAF